MRADSPKPSHREAKKEESRRAIARAALALFEARGFEETTIDEIARAAGVSRPTVFNYFPHKEDILPEAIGTLIRDRILASLPGGLEGAASNPIEALRRLIVSSATVFREYPETGRAFHVFKMQQAISRFGRPGRFGAPGDSGGCGRPGGFGANPASSGRRPVPGGDDPERPFSGPNEPSSKAADEPMEFFTWIDMLVQRAQETGAFRRDYAVTEIRFHLAIGLFASTLGPWARGYYGDVDLADLVSRHFDLYIEGLGT